MKELGFEVMHVYGLTETYGHVTQCAWNDAWNDFDEEKQNEIKARQGVRYPNTEGIAVMDPETMTEVPKDGKTIGEIMIKGNVVMKGYFKDKDATNKAMAGGWFHSGDLAVMHPDGYVKIQDRSKDIIDKEIFDLLEKANNKSFQILENCKNILDDLSDLLIDKNKLDRRTIELKIYRKLPKLLSTLY